MMMCEEELFIVSSAGEGEAEKGVIISLDVWFVVAERREEQIVTWGCCGPLTGR